jgi:hypothetical protein
VSWGFLQMWSRFFTVVLLSNLVIFSGCAESDALGRHDAGEEPRGVPDGWDWRQCEHDFSTDIPTSIYGEEYENADAGTRPDQDLENEFLIIVPERISMCTAFYEGENWRQAAMATGRIVLRPGHYIVPKDGESEPVEFIERVYFGRYKDEPIPVPEGARLYAISGVYSTSVGYERNFMLGDRLYSVQVYMHLGSNWDLPTEMTIRANDVHMYTHIGPGEDGAEQAQSFGTCGHPGFGDNIVAMTPDCNCLSVYVGGGSGCGTAGMTQCYRLNYAEVTLYGQTRVVTDGVHLVYSAGHHNCDEKYVVILEPPIGDVAAVMYEPMYIHHLDENFEVLRTENTAAFWWNP